MILDSKFEQLVRQNFLRSSREYDLAKYFWSNSERAMQQKPTQQPTLTTQNLTDKERTYVTDELAKYFAGFAWRVPQYVLDRESDQRDYAEHIKQHNFSRSELQSMQAHNKDLIKSFQEDIEHWFNEQSIYRQAFKKGEIDLDFDPELTLHISDQLDFIRNKISSTKLKLKKLVALQTKIKRLLAK